MQNIRKGSHSVHQLHVHLVWSTKYRYDVLRGGIQVRCKDLIRQTCDTLDIQILKGVVSQAGNHIRVTHTRLPMNRELCVRGSFGKPGWIVHPDFNWERHCFPVSQK